MADVEAYVQKVGAVQDGQINPQNLKNPEFPNID